MIAKLTIVQKNLIAGQQFTPGSYFNPIQDINDKWVISEEEVNQCNNPEFPWVNDLQLSEYLPKPADLLI